QVGEDMDELNPAPRHGRLDFNPNFIDHLENRSGALTRRLEARDDVTRVLSRSEQPELGAGPAGRALDLGRLGQYPLDYMDLTIRLGEGSPTGCEVIENECSLIHFRQKPRSDESLGNHACHDENPGGNEDASPVMQHSLEGFLVPHGQRVELMSNAV